MVPAMRRTFTKDLNEALERCLNRSTSVLLLGEDIRDPFGGAFKVSQGLSSKYPDRVVNTPISEAGILGIANGMAMRGMRPVVEIMFGDFLGLCMDQLLNHTVKFQQMYGQKQEMPLVLRTPMGGGRGYGATHSQTLEKHFLGIPGLRVVAPCLLNEPGNLLEYAVLNDDGPVLFIEGKGLYPQLMPDMQDGWCGAFQIERSDADYPVLLLSPADFDSPDVTIAVYGEMTPLAMDAAQQLLVESEKIIEIIVFSELLTDNCLLFNESLQRSGRLLTLEEGTLSLGWGAEIIARAAAVMPNLRSARVASKNMTLPSAISLEKKVLPCVDDVLNAAKRLLDEI